MVTKAKEPVKDAVAEKKEPTMTFPDLRGIHILRITDEKDPNKVVCEIHTERNVFGWDKDTKTCESSRIIQKIYKPLNGKMVLVKDNRIATKEDTKMIWMGTMIKPEEAKSTPNTESC